MEMYQRGRASQSSKERERMYLADCRTIRDGLGVADVRFYLSSSSVRWRLAHDAQELREGKLQTAMKDCAMSGVLSLWYAPISDEGSWPMYDPDDGVCMVDEYTAFSGDFPSTEQCVSERLGDCEQIALFCRALDALEILVNEVYHPVPISCHYATPDPRWRSADAQSRVEYARFLICLLVGRLKKLALRDLSEYLVEHLVLHAEGDMAGRHVEDGELDVPLIHFQ